MNYHQIFKQTWSRYTEQEALVYDQLCLTFNDLEQLVEQLASQFENAGIVTGTVVAFMLQNPIGFVACFLAICRCRAISVFFDSDVTIQELHTIINDSHCNVILADHDRCSQILDRLKVKAGMTHINFIEDEALSIIAFNEMPIASDNQIGKSFDDIAILQFTSGSAGTPKCVVRSHENIISAAVNFVSTIGYREDDRIVCTTPLYHAYALNTCLLSSIYTGACLILPKYFNPIEILRIIEEQHVSILVSIPYLYKLLTEFRPNIALSIDSLRLCISGGGAALLPKTAHSFSNRFHISPIQIYGSTESAEITFHKDGAHEGRLSKGIPFKNVKLKVVGLDGNELAVNEIGEIIVRSKAVSPGYKNHIKYSPFNNGWYHTNDMGFIDENTELNITGRIRSTISVSGKKVDPNEVEKVLNSHPNVVKAFVIGQKDPICGEILKAIVVIKKACSRSDIVQYCQKHLTPFKIPQIVEFTDHLPTSATGKVQLKKLMDLASI
jgi:long-chain acyl-CoA synthetase